MKIFTALYLLLLIYGCSLDIKDQNEYLKIKYYGSEDYPFTELVFSTEKIDKEKIIGRKLKFYSDTLFVDNIVVSNDIFLKLKDAVILLAGRENKIQSKSLKEDGNIFYFEILITVNSNDLFKDEVFLLENSLEYFSRLDVLLGNNQDAERINKTIKSEFINRILLIN